MSQTKRRFSFDPTFLIDLMTIFCLSAGPVLLALEILDHSRALPVCCMLVGAQMLFLLLITRKWWVLPSLLALSGAAFGIAVWALEWEVVSAYFIGLYEWLLDGLAIGTDYESLRLPVYALATLPLTALNWLLIRRLFHILPHALIAFGVNFTLYLMECSDWQGVLLLSLGGLIVCLPRAAQNRRDPLPRKFGQLLALGLAVLCLAGAFYIVPQHDGAWRVEAVRMLFSDVQDWYDNQFGSGAGGASGVVSELMPLGDRLGGDLDRSANLTLRVDSNYEVLLAGRYDDTYNGTQWYHGWQNGRFRWGSLLWRSRRSEAFQHKLPVGGRNAYALYDNMTRIVDVEIMAQTKDYTLYAPTTAQYVNFDRRDDIYPYFNRVGELFADRYFASGTEYTVRAVQLCRDMKYFDNNMHKLLELTAAHSDPYEEEIRLRYTWLPEDLPESIGALQQEITQGARNDYDAMCLIEQWLAENCTYNETPGTPPEGVDFVAHFLETREGYCTYYASAMAVMARTYGLPSRYVTGYGLVREGESTRHYVARELSSHAWAEVYFHGIGWVAFDPLNWDADDLADEEFGNREVTGVVSATPTPTPTPAATPAFAGELPEIEQKQENNAAWVIKLVIWLISIALIAALLLITVRFLMKRKDKQFAPERMLRKMGRREAGMALFDDMEAQLQLYNLSRADGETLRTWAERVDRSLPLEEATCAGIIAIHERMLYGHGAPFDEELQVLGAYHAAVEAALRLSLGRSYLWRRAIR